jgi:hypothetical protein
MKKTTRTVGKRTTEFLGLMFFLCPSLNGNSGCSAPRYIQDAQQTRLSQETESNRHKFYFTGTGESLVGDVYTFSLEKKLEKLGDNEGTFLNSNYDKLRKETLDHQYTNSRKDLEYFWLKEQLNDLKNRQDTFFDSNMRLNLEKRLEQFRDYTPTISESDWKEAYKKSKQIFQQETGDPGILFN